MGGAARLRYGVTYTAKYVLLASYVSFSGGGPGAGVKVTAVKKSSASTATGAIDVNVVIVGTKNITASRTAAGQRNLDTLFQGVENYYEQANTGLHLGSVQAVEWDCDHDGDAFANTELSQLGTLSSPTAARWRRRGPRARR